jgi:hypothetical protein
MSDSSRTPRFAVWHKGSRVVVSARDRMHARIIGYAAIWPESVWADVKAYEVRDV